MTSTVTQAHRVFVFSHPRTACHLFFQLLTTHPVFQVVSPFCCAAAYVVGTEPQEARSREEWRDLLAMSEEDAAKVTWQGCIDDLQRGVAEAEMNKKWALTMDHPHFMIPSSRIKRYIDIRGREARPIPVVVDRMLDVRVLGAGYSQFDLPAVAHPNPTLLPDRFFFSFTPIIMIRHPARVIPSYLRAFQRLGNDLFHPDFPPSAECFRLERLVFDSFKSADSNTQAPIVIDGDKLVRDPRGQMKKLCALLGIDDSQLRYSWDPPSFGEKTKLARAFLGDFSRSTGVFSNPRAGELNMEAEVRSWAKEWDEDTARILEKKVTAQMEDYEYLLQFSL